MLAEIFMLRAEAFRRALEEADPARNWSGSVRPSSTGGHTVRWTMEWLGNRIKSLGSKSTRGPFHL
jgi:hypothetical protein